MTPVSYLQDVDFLDDKLFGRVFSLDQHSFPKRPLPYLPDPSVLVHVSQVDQTSQTISNSNMSEKYIWKIREENLHKIQIIQIRDQSMD